jgi:hypothetical protein
VVQQKIEGMFKQPPPKVIPRSPVAIDREATCAQLFDNYAQSLTAGK